MDKRKQIVILKSDNKTILAYMIGSDIYDVIINDEDDKSPKVGDVYLGKVIKVVKNINAAFVDIGSEKPCYLKIPDQKKDVIRAQKDVIVQVKKPEKNEKGAVLSTDISIVSRYMVTNSDKKTIKRTNACALSEEIFNEIRLKEESVMDYVLSHGLKRTSKSLLYREPPFFIREINAHHIPDLDRIVTDDEEVFCILKEYYLNTSENVLDKTGHTDNFILDGSIDVELYSDPYSLDALYSINHHIKKALNDRVFLDSGACIFIEKTEAATMIDVNTAKAIKGSDQKEEHFLKINIEAALEIARQLRTRQISGIVLIDFIDMKKDESYDILKKTLTDELKKDPVKASFIDFTALGIAEITRAKRHRELKEVYNIPMTD